MAQRMGMADGRMFTQYLGAQFQNDNQKKQIGEDSGTTLSNYDYRLYLQQTGKLYYKKDSACNPNQQSFGMICYERVSR